MNPHVRDKLCQMVAQYGVALIADTRRCEGLLRDLCPQDKREIHVLVGALRERVPAELAAPAMQQGAAAIGRLAKRLEDNLALAEAPARWAVESWALALGVVTRQQLAAAQPKRRPQDASVVPPPVAGAPLTRPASRGRIVAVAVLLLALAPAVGVALAWNTNVIRGFRSRWGGTARPPQPAASTESAQVVANDPPTAKSPTAKVESSKLDRPILRPAPDVSQPPTAEEEAIVREEFERIEKARKQNPP